MTQAEINTINDAMTQCEAYDDAYIAACELDSPNSPDFDNVFKAELLKRGIEL